MRNHRFFATFATCLVLQGAMLSASGETPVLEPLLDVPVPQGHGRLPLYESWSVLPNGSRLTARVHRSVKSAYAIWFLDTPDARSSPHELRLGRVAPSGHWFAELGPVMTLHRLEGSAPRKWREITRGDERLYEFRWSRNEDWFIIGTWDPPGKQLTLCRLTDVEHGNAGQPDIRLSVSDYRLVNDKAHCIVLSASDQSLSLLDLQRADPLSSAVTLLENVSRWWTSGQWMFAQGGGAIHVWDLSRPVEAMPFTVLPDAAFELPQSAQGYTHTDGKGLWFAFLDDSKLHYYAENNAWRKVTLTFRGGLIQHVQYEGWADRMERSADEKHLLFRRSIWAASGPAFSSAGAGFNVHLWKIDGDSTQSTQLILERYTRRPFSNAPMPSSNYRAWRSVQFSEDGTKVLGIPVDGRVTVWDISGGLDRASKYDPLSEDVVKRIVRQPDGMYFIQLDGGRLAICDEQSIHASPLAHVLDCELSESGYFTIATRQDRIAVVSESVVRLVDVSGVIPKLLDGPTTVVPTKNPRVLRFDDDWLIVASTANLRGEEHVTAYRCQADSGEMEPTTLSTGELVSTGGMWSDNKLNLFVGRTGALVQIWDLDATRPLEPIAAIDAVATPLGALLSENRTKLGILLDYDNGQRFQVFNFETIARSTDPTDAEGLLQEGGGTDR